MQRRADVLRDNAMRKTRSFRSDKERRPTGVIGQPNVFAATRTELSDPSTSSRDFDAIDCK